METTAGEMRPSGQHAVVPAPPLFATPYRSFGGLIAAVACVGVFLGLFGGMLVTAVVTRGQLDAVVTKIDDQRRADATQREADAREVRRDLDAQRMRLAAAEERIKTVESHAAWTHAALEAIAARLRVVVPIPR